MPLDEVIHLMKTKEQEIRTEDILDHWGQGKTTLDWRPLTIKGKREWLKACLSWTGIPHLGIPSLNYIIDGSQVTTDLDFYCLLGETFFGYRGYFGQDLDGLDDCFVDIKVSPETTLTIRNHEELADVLNGEINTYFTMLIDIFKEHGLEIRLE